MGTVLGIGIPLVIVGVFAVLIWLVVRSGLKKKQRNLALMRYAQDRGHRWVGDDLSGRLEGQHEGRSLSVEFAIVQCSADPSAGVSSVVPRMQKLETVLRMSLPGTNRRALVGKPFFRGAIHDPLRGSESVDLGDPAFQQVFQVQAPPGEGCEWLDAKIRASLVRLGARELRLDQGELSLNLEGMIPDPKRLDRALELLANVAGRVG